MHKKYPYEPIIKNGVVTVGEFIFTAGDLNLTAPDVFNRLLGNSSYRPSYGGHKGALRKRVAKDIEGSPAGFYRKWCARMYECYIKDVVPRELLFSIAKKHRPQAKPNPTFPTNKWGYNLNTYKTYVDNKSMYDQAIKDGLTHLLPILLLTQKCPKESKKLFGNALWKHFCHSSRYRNERWAEAFKLSYLNFSESPLTKVVLSLISTEAPLYSGTNLYTALVLKSTGCSKEWVILSNRINDRGRRRFRTLLQDTTSMLSELEGEVVGYRFREHKPSSITNLETLKIYHDKVLAKYNKMKYSKNYDFSHLEKYSEWKHTSDDGAYEATVITTPEALYEEGQKMKHCVYSYANSVAKKNYLVVSIRKNGEKYSTLGLTLEYKKDYYYYDFKAHSIDNVANWGLQQHYAAMNHPVTSCAAEFATEVINKLNSEGV